MRQARIASGRSSEAELLVIPAALQKRWAMPAVVAQSGGYGPQLLAILATRDAVTRGRILQELRCSAEWLDAWLRPPYFALGPGWTWTITTAGVDAIGQHIMPPHLTKGFSS